MARGPRSRSSPRPHQPLLGLTFFILLLLLVEQTRSVEEYPESYRDWANDLTYYQSWNYGRNRLIREMRATIAKNEKRINEMDRVIQYIRNVSNIEPTLEERFAELKCPQSYHITPVNTTVECVLIARSYTTYKEATDTCESMGGYLAVLDDFHDIGKFLVEGDNAKRFDLSHDTFWVGAMMRDRTFIKDSPSGSGSVGMTDTRQMEKFCGVLHLDLQGDDHRLSAERCDDSQRYPYLCEFDSGSEFNETRSQRFRQICPVGFELISETGECFFLSSFEESRNYHDAGKSCASIGASVMHPRNMTFFTSGTHTYHSLIGAQRRFFSKPPPREDGGFAIISYQSLLESMVNATKGQNFEFGIWLNDSVRNDDQDWGDLMQQTGQSGNGETGTDMCLLLKANTINQEVHKEVGKCSSSQLFLCSINLHPKVLGLSFH